jgi:hypothetical protein
MMGALGIMLARSLSGRWVLDIIDILAVSELVKSPVWQSEGRKWLVDQSLHGSMILLGRPGWLEERLKKRLRVQLKNRLERLENLENLEQVEWLKRLEELEQLEGKQYLTAWNIPKPEQDSEPEQRERRERRERERRAWERDKQRHARDLRRRVGDINVRGGHLTFYATYFLLVHLIEFFIYIAFILFFAGLAVLVYTDQRSLGIGLLVIISVIATVYLLIVLHNLFAIYIYTT